MNIKGILLAAVTLIITTQFACSQEKPVNWTKDQLEEPADLARAINDGKDIPVIINVGPGAIIPHSLNAGPASEPAAKVNWNQS